MDIKPKYRNGQTLVNKKTGKEIMLDKAQYRRQATKGYRGISDEFTGEYSYTSFDDKGKQSQGEISEDILERFFEKPS